MNIKKTLSILLVAAAMFQLTGCKSSTAKELLSQIQSGAEISVSAAAPSNYAPTITGSETALKYGDVDTDKLTTHTESGFRTEFNKLFELNRISDRAYGDGLQGCLFVTRFEDQDVTNGKACLADAFRNKAFIEEFWQGSKSIQTVNKITELAAKEYSDIEETSGAALYAGLNAYYNLFPDYAVDSKSVAFSPDAPLTREQFYAFAYRSQNSIPLEPVEYDPNTDEFSLMVKREPTTDKDGNTVTYDWPTSYTKYAREVDQYAWLNTEDQSINGSTIARYITRAEAVYLLVRQNFPELYQQATDATPAYNDTVNNGDMAQKLGFRDTEKGTALPRWKAYTLYYMVQNPDKGMQSELYKAMAVAKSLDLINDTNARWSEAISRQEAIKMVIDCQLAANKQHGYNTIAKNGEIVALVELPKQDIPADIMERINNLSEKQLEVFEYVAGMYEEELKTGKMTQEEVDKQRMMEFDNKVINGTLVNTISDLFPYWAYWKDYTNIYPDKTLIGGSLAGENIYDDKSQGNGIESNTEENSTDENSEEQNGEEQNGEESNEPQVSKQQQMMDFLASLGGNKGKTSLTGQEVIDIVSNYKNILTDYPLQFRVCTLKQMSGIDYGYFTVGTKDERHISGVKLGQEIGAYEEASENDSNYINPNSEFKVEEVENSKEIIIMYRFVEQRPE